jgi:hypothetical protein
MTVCVDKSEKRAFNLVRSQADVTTLIFMGKTTLINLTLLLLAAAAGYFIFISVNQSSSCTVENAKPPDPQTATNQQAEKYAKCKPLTALLRKEATNSQVSSLTEKLENISGVYLVKYVPQEEALNTFKERGQFDPSLLNLFPKETFPASVEVYLKDPSLKKEVMEFLKEQPLVEKVI